ncbi:MAG: hypothetical protein E6H75_12170 [Betaproteobacteria bacterium]|nr:MAG: hypothetical protein E6H75_12170 [Betaproteobacteria bacterium]
MNSGYEQAARRLSGLAEDDRDWLLARLPEVDRLRITELIERGESGPQVNPPLESSSEDSASTPESTVAAASAAEVAGALRDEPDWLVALILAKRRWPWDRDYLNEFEPARVERLRDIARSVRDIAKPRMCDEAVAALAMKLHRSTPAPEPRSAFDEVLTGIMARPETTRDEGSEAWRQ